MTVSRSPIAPFLLRAAAVGLTALAGACATSGQSLDRPGAKADYRDEITSFANPAAEDGVDPVAAAAHWSVIYNKNPSDPVAAVR